MAVADASQVTQVGLEISKWANTGAVVSCILSARTASEHAFDHTHGSSLRSSRRSGAVVAE